MRFEAIKMLELGDAAKLGRVMNAAHFTLSALSRGAQEIDKLVGGLAGTPGVLGTKTSGSGPGGALVIARDPGVAPGWDSNRSWEEVVLEHGHSFLLRSVRDA
jgi:mevalonate kinase